VSGTRTSVVFAALRKAPPVKPNDIHTDLLSHNPADDCDNAGAHCIANSKTLDPHRALGFFLTLPGALLFLIVALVAWLPEKRARIVSIVAPILTFVQMILPGLGRWGGAFHPLNAILILGLYAWLFYELRRDPRVEPEPSGTGAPAPG